MSHKHINNKNDCNWKALTAEMLKMANINSESETRRGERSLEDLVFTAVYRQPLNNANTSIKVGIGGFDWFVLSYTSAIYNLRRHCQIRSASFVFAGTKVLIKKIVRKPACVSKCLRCVFVWVRENNYEISTLENLWIFLFRSEVRAGWY